MQKLWIYALLAAVTCALYWPVRHFGFINYDDETYVYENKHVTEGLTASNVAWAFQSFEVANYHPLTWISWLLDSSVFGVQRPGAFHIENVLLHVLSTLLLFGLLESATGDRWLSAFVAAIFALHPVHVESVVWVSERKDVLSTAFMLLAMWMYLEYARAGAGAKRLLWYAAMVACYACGLLAKPMIVTFPFLLMLLDYWPLRRVWNEGPSRFRQMNWRASWLEKSPLLLLSFGSSIITYEAQRAGGAILNLEHVSFPMRVANVFVSYVRYLGKSFWPEDLSPYYPYRGDWSLAFILASLALLLSVTVLCVGQNRRRPYLIVGWLWFLGTLVPVIGVIQAGGQSIADRYLYVPMIGVAIMAAWLGSEVLRSSRAIAATLAILILLAAGATARHQMNYWQDTRTLFEHALLVTQRNAVAHVQLGYLDARERNTANAIDHYNQAIEFAPADYVPEFDLANLLLKEHPDQAIEHYQRAAEKNPYLAKIQNNWGTALVGLGRPREAFEHFKAAVQIDPNYLEAHYDLGQMLFTAGFYDQARAEFETVLRLDPNFAGARRGLDAIKSIPPKN